MRARKLVAILLAAALFALGTRLALAQSGYDIRWFTVDGGGGESAGGIYTLAGSIGQPDVAALSGGEYTVVGGVWTALEPNQYRYLPVILK